MSMAYKEMQCLELWVKVKIEKLQNDLCLISHSFSAMMSFPMSLWLLCILTWTLAWSQTNKQTNKFVYKQSNNKQTDQQTCMHGHLKLEDSNHLISHYVNHNRDIDQMKWQGLDLHGFPCLLSQRSLISSMFIAFQWNDQGSVLGGWPKCLHHRLEPHLQAVNELTRALRTKDITPHKRTCSLWTLHDHCMAFILQLFNWDLVPYFEVLPFPRWHNHNKLGIILKRIVRILLMVIKNASIITKKTLK